MPSREEIVDQLNKAADIFEMIGIEFLGKQALKDYADKMRKLAAQVAAMRCETCKHYEVHGDGTWCFNPKYPMCFIVKPDFGCFHHEQKEKE
jgi:hypothetical protein